MEGEKSRKTVPRHLPPSLRLLDLLPKRRLARLRLMEGSPNPTPKAVFENGGPLFGLPRMPSEGDSMPPLSAYQAGCRHIPSARQSE